MAKIARKWSKITRKCPKNAKKNDQLLHQPEWYLIIVNATLAFNFQLISYHILRNGQITELPVQ